MIDNLLEKVDPAQFVTMIEKLSAALPPPGQAVLNPFLVVLKQACEVKAQMQGAMQGVKSQVAGGKFGSGAHDVTLQASSGTQRQLEDQAMPQDVIVTMSTPEKKGFRFELVIIGFMSLFGVVTLGILTAMAVSPDCGCTDTCELAQKWAAACPADCDFCNV